MIAPKVALGDVCEITMGQAPSGDSYNTEGDGVALIAGAGDFGDLTPEPSKFTTAPTKLSRPNEVILCIRATIGDRNWSDKTYCLGRGVAGLLGKKGQLDENYLWHWLGHAAPELKSKGRGATFLQVSKADIASLEIPLPPLAEQRRIAAILDKADALRAKRREAIAKLDQLLQSVFLDMFGDCAIFSRVPIGAICEVKGGKRLPKGEDYAEESTPYRYIRVSDIAMGHVQEDGLKYLKPDVQSRIKRYTVAAGDVIITIAGTIGVVAPVGKSLSGANLTENAAKLVAKRRGEFVPDYLAFALSMPEAQAQIRSQTGQVTIGKLALFRIEKVEIPLPPLDEQRKFASMAEAVGKQKNILSRNVEQMDSMFTSLQNRAFAGTL